MLFYTTCCQGCQVLMKSVESYSTKVIAIHDEGDGLIHCCWNFVVQVTPMPCIQLKDWKGILQVPEEKTVPHIE
jgi:hypothetical protein